MEEGTVIRRWPLTARIMAGMVLGVAFGTVLGARATPLGEIGKLVIQLIKAIATPLLFLAVLNAILKTSMRWSSGARMMSIAIFNASLALLIGLSVSNWIKPGTLLDLHGVSGGAGAPKELQRIDVLQALASYVPANVVSPFLENSVISLVILALLLGFGLRRVREERSEGAALLEQGIGALLRTLEVGLGWVIQLIPVAVFAVVAKAVGEQGFAPLRGLGAYVGVALLGMLIHVLIVHQAWIAWAAPRSGRSALEGLRAFWTAAKEPVIYAAGVNSSLATLPVTLRALDRLGVSRASSTLGACVGTNFNNDGIILYEGMAVLMVAQAYGLDLSFGQQLGAALACMIAGIGVAGVPEAGFISLSLVLTTVGLPTEHLPLLLTVDWIVARGRSVLNVLSDMVVSSSLDASQIQSSKGAFKAAEQ